jgi:very-short-patch-repair endonuclease
MLGDILNKGSFAKIEAYQEVPIQYWDPENLSILFIDWYLPLFKLVIELHGEHHYKTVRWNSGMSENEARLNLISQRNRDFNKKSILKENGIEMIEIPYKDKKILSESYLVGRIRGLNED